MRQLKPYITLLVLLLLIGCGGSGLDRNAVLESTPVPVDFETTGTQTVRMQLEASELQDGEWSIMLRSTAAEDLYQIAGTLEYDSTEYELLSVEAGGGLGSPDEAYFINSELVTGAIDFAYTSRYHGRVNSGDLNLLRLRVRTSGQFSVDRFKLRNSDGELLVRDSRKRELTVISGRDSS